MRGSLVILSASLALILVDNIAGTQWFGDYDKLLMGVGVMVSCPIAYFVGPGVMEETVRRRQARIANPDAYPAIRFTNAQRFAILAIAGLPALIIAANCFAGSNWFGHYGLIAVAAGVGGFVIVNSLVHGPRRESEKARREMMTEKSVDASD